MTLHLISTVGLPQRSQGSLPVGRPLVVGMTVNSGIGLYTTSYQYAAPRSVYFQRMVVLPGGAKQMTTQRLVIGALGGAVLLALLGLLAFGLMNQEPLTSQSGAQRQGKPAPEFALKTFDGREVRLADFRGKPVVVNFWASWCAPCRVEMPHLTEAYLRHKDEGVVFIGINVQDTKRNADEFLRDFEIPEGYFILSDPTGGVTVDYGVSGLPITFFIDPAGQVRKRWVGALNIQVLEEQIGLIASAPATTRVS